MSSIFDTNARADESLMGGEPAARAVGLPTTVGLPGTFAPGGSNATAQGLLQQMQARTQSMMNEATAQPAREPVVGYNPQDNTVFSGGKTFKLDLNEGRQNAALLDTDNAQLPQGYLPVRSSQVKARLAREYEDLDIIDDSQRAFGQMASGIGSALRDVGADNVGPALEQFGGDIARRNPSKINSFQDIVDSPLVTAGEAVGEAGFEVGRYATLGAAGTAAGAALGAGLTAATGGLAAPTIPIFAFLGNRVANWVPTFAQTYGGIRAEQREAGIDNKERAAGAALGSSALDFLLGPEMRVARAIGGPLTRAAVGKVDNIAQARDFLAKGAPAGTASYGRNAAVDFFGESGTEIAQTGLERYGAEKDLTSEDALNEYAVAGVKGGIGGVALSPVGTAAENRREIAEKMPEYQQVKNFVENLRADMALAADPGAPSAERMRAAKRAQDVLRGSSDDPEFDAVLQEFRQKLSFVDTQIVAGATREALATNAPVNLMESRPAFFERGAEQVQTTVPSDLSAYEAPAPMGREPRAPQQVDTGAPMQQVETLQPMGPFITPGQRTVAGFPALNETMDQIQSGQIAREGLPVTGELTPGQQAALVRPTPLNPIQRALRGVSLDLDQPATTGTIEPVSKVVGAPATLTPSAPAAEGAFSAAAPLQQVETLPPSQRTQPTNQPVAVDDAETLTGEDNKAMLRLIDEANDAADTGRTLPAAVQGDSRIAAPGKVTMSTAALARIRDALVKGKEAKGEKEQRIVAALERFAAAYKEYLDIGGEARIGAGSTVKGERIRRRGAAAQTQAVADAAATVRRELEAVGVAVGGNAKDVEAIVRLVKNLAQGKIAVPGRTRESVIKGMGSFDAMLSSAWNAAKRETFFGDAADRADVRGQPIRASKERSGERSPIEVAVVDGYLSLGDQRIIDGEANRKRKGMEKDGAKKADIDKAVAELRTRRSAELKAKRKGIGAALQYIIDAGTPFERTIATALRDTLDNQMNDVTVVFIDSGTPSFDPATNTITLRRSESPEVILHETLHAALQSFVYNNPNHPAVKQLKKSLKAVVDYKGTLGAKAKAVQDLLKKLVADNNELDAVLELVSYGNTLNEFRRAMQAMPSKGTPKSFYESVSNVWNYIRDILSGLLGVKDTVANDVLDASVMLLESAGKKTPTRNKGGRLDAAVDTATAAFKRWFGNSKVVDKSGKPLVVYTGTSKDVDFGTFKLPKNGAWFTTSPEEASGYAIENDSMGHKYNPDTRTYEAVNTASRVIPVYLRIENPYTLTADEQNMMRMAQNYKRAQGIIFERAKARGHDGVDLGGGVWVVIADSNQIKSAISNKGTYSLRSGNILEAAITSDEIAGGNPLDTPDTELLRRPGGDAASLAGIEVYNRRIVPAKVSTKVLFDAIGWDKLVTNVDEKLITPLMNKIRNEAPTLTRWISYINANFSVPQDARATFRQFKNDKQAGYKVSERLATYVQFQPDEKITSLFAYLDGDKSALADDPATRELADDVKAWRDFYVQELNDPRAKEFFARGKFSETMLFATEQERVAGDTFGVRKLNQLLGQKTQFDPTLESTWMQLNDEGDPILDKQRFFEVLENVNGRLAHAGFIAESKFKAEGAPVGFTVDPTFLWYHQEKTKRGHKFVANMTAAQAIKEKRADDLANALRNTMAALAGGYASVQFANSIAQYEAGSVNALAFDSVDQINKLFDIEVSPKLVLNAGSQEARQKRTQHEYRTPNLWVRLPKDAKYGALAGKIVRGSVWSAMNDMSDRRPVVDVRLLNNSMRWFKKSKTIYNIGTHLTNVATNISLAMLHDIPLGTVSAATRLFFLYEVSPNKLTEQERQIVRAFMNSNAMLGDFSSAEVKEALHNAMVASLREGASPSLYGRVATMMGFERQKAEEMKKLVGKNLDRADQIITEVYAAEDNIFRLAAFMKFAADSAAQNGTPDLQGAGDFAREAFLDYDIDSKAVRIARQTVLPFVSWTYAIIPVLSRIAVHKPWQMANFLLAYTILEHALQELGGGEEEDERLRKVGPEYIRDRMFNFGPYMHVRVPFLGDDDNPVYYRLGDYNPMASLARGLPNGFMGLSWLPSAITPTGPFVSFITAAVSGVDPYTGKPLSPPTDTDWGKFADRSKYIISQFLPNYPINPTQWERAEEIWKGGRTDRTDNYAALQMARWAGLKLYDYNVDQAQIAQFRAAKAIMGEYKQEIGKLRRAEARLENPDWDAFREKQAELLQRMQEEMAKAKGEE